MAEEQTQQEHAATRPPRGWRRFVKIAVPALLVGALAGAGITFAIEQQTASDSETLAESSSPRANSAPRTARPTVADGGAETCELLEPSEAKRLLGGKKGVANPGMTGGTPNCQWITADGHYVQVIHTPSPKWAEGLPLALETMKTSGIASDPQNMRKLRQGARLVEAGKKLNASQACSMFSRMVELQGRPGGSHDIVTVFPTSEEPLGVTGQICSDGTFTSVLIANKTRRGEFVQLERPLPMIEVMDAARLIHARTSG